MQIKKFVFNPFQVNTYLIYDQTGECVIIDAACGESREEEELFHFIQNKGLKPAHLLSTHQHIDHILGNDYASETYDIPLSAHADGLVYLTNAIEHAQSFGLQLRKVCQPKHFLQDGQIIRFGESSLKVLHTPGHALGSVCFYSKEDGFVVAGDVLFYQSIGRTDLPGGDYDVLKQSIWEKLFVLPESTIVYPGHGPETTIGSEKVSNPFVAIG